MPGDARETVDRIARERSVAFSADGGLPLALFDERALATAVDALLDATRPATARLVADADGVVLQLEGGTADVPETVLYVTPEREIRSGLLMPRTLLERQGGSLTAEGTSVRARLRRA